MSCVVVASFTSPRHQTDYEAKREGFPKRISSLEWVTTLARERRALGIQDPGYASEMSSPKITHLSAANFTRLRSHTGCALNCNT